MLFFINVATAYVILAGLLSTTLARPGIDVGQESRAREAAPTDTMAESTEKHVKRGIKIPDGPVWRCYNPDELGPAPPVEDCRDVIQQFEAIPGDITVKLVEACIHIVSGNCTGSLCPQRLGSSTIPAMLAAQYMTSPILENCISKGQRGWWNEGQQWGVGLYLA
ncbi:hypothetical protein F5X99DRAFT_412020 [Biscogniauxia marginata]|nr:hypothetical protein F5X99DRAFT_412020 [Biscogniauxia marginata]